jgi:hypothetical protein
VLFHPPITDAVKTLWMWGFHVPTTTSIFTLSLQVNTIPHSLYSHFNNRYCYSCHVGRCQYGQYKVIRIKCFPSFSMKSHQCLVGYLLVTMWLYTKNFFLIPLWQYWMNENSDIKRQSHSIWKWRYEYLDWILFIPIEKSRINPLLNWSARG